MRGVRRRPIAIDEYRALVGNETGVSRWFAVDQPRIDAFADITEDRQFIHIDPDAARAIAVRRDDRAWLSHPVDAFGAGDGRFARHRGPHNGRQLRLRQIALPFARAGRRAHPRTLQARERHARARRPNISAATIVTVEIEGAAKPALIAEWLTLIDPRSRSRKGRPRHDDTLRRPRRDRHRRRRRARPLSCAGPRRARREGRRQRSRPRRRALGGFAARRARDRGGRRRRDGRRRRRRQRRSGRGDGRARAQTHGAASTFSSTTPASCATRPSPRWSWPISSSCCACI